MKHRYPSYPYVNYKEGTLGEGAMVASQRRTAVTSLESGAADSGSKFGSVRGVNKPSALLAIWSDSVPVRDPPADGSPSQCAISGSAV